MTSLKIELNNLINELQNDLKIPTLIKVFSVPFIILLAAVVISIQYSIPPAELFRDPSAVANISPFVGVVSNLGVFLWSSTATLCLFSWLVLSQQFPKSEFTHFYFWSGVLSLMLFFDDLFLLHENVLPNQLGISQKMVFVGYGLLFAGWSIWFHRALLKSQYSFLLIAFFFLAGSIGVDGLQELFEAWVGQWRIFLEDGAKFLGICSWFVYFLKNAQAELLHTQSTN